MKITNNIRSKYSYQKYERVHYSNNIRKDLRKKLKSYSIKIHEPECKILDILIEELLNKNKKEQNEFLEKVRNYY